MSVVELGGARVTEAVAGEVVVCSAARARRALAGELAGEELSLALAHLGGCPRCQAVREEVERERAALQAAVPFEAFAAGVAEKLALAEAQVAGAAGGSSAGTHRGEDVRAGAAGRWGAGDRLLRAAGIAAAAAVLLFGVTRTWTQREGEAPLPVAGSAGPGASVRSKGGAGVALFVLRASRSFALREGERLRPGDRLLPSLEPGGHAFALVVLVEEGEAAVLYRGPARAGPLPEAFEWTGSARAALVVAVYSQAAVDEAAVLPALRASQAPAGQGMELAARAIVR